MSHHYRKVSVRIINDADYKALKHYSRLIWREILSYDRMLPIGAMRAPLSGLAEDFDFSKKQFLRYFFPIVEAGFIRFDEKTKLLWVPNFLIHNTPDNPNVIKGWIKYIDYLPEGNERDQLFQHLAQWVSEHLTPSFIEALPEPFRKGLAKQEQEQESNSNNKILLLGEHVETSEKTDENEIIFSLPIKNKKFNITQSSLDDYQKTYPSVNVQVEFEKMLEWLNNNPKKKPSNVGRFIANWLNKTQDQGAQIHPFGRGNKNGNNSNPGIFAKKQSAFEQAINGRAEWTGSIG